MKMLLPASFALALVLGPPSAQADLAPGSKIGRAHV